MARWLWLKTSDRVIKIFPPIQCCPSDHWSSPSRISCQLARFHQPTLQLGVDALLTDGRLRHRIRHAAVGVRCDVVRAGDVAAGALADVVLAVFAFSKLLLRVAARVGKTLLIGTTLQCTVALRV